MGIEAGVKSLSACAPPLHIGVRVILQRVERLENIGKVREKGARSFCPADNRMHTE